MAHSLSLNVQNNEINRNIDDYFVQTIPMAPFWQRTGEYLKRLRANGLASLLNQWLDVDEAEIVQILETLRTQLPTTEAILIGKPQAGKSSLVRGLTGVSAEIVGQGFRPHTQHTQRYAYPSDDLPLLVFTDTVGLGDVNQDTDQIIEELIKTWQPEAPAEDVSGDGMSAKPLNTVNETANEQTASEHLTDTTADTTANTPQQSSQDNHNEDTVGKRQRARVLILTVKINDFAIDSLRQIVARLRRQYPTVPCLLVVTCVHEVYPPEIENHPPYPPDLPDVNHPFAALKETLEAVCDRALLVDFTLEEDGYTPVFYGLAALRDTLADLLPEAEARTLSQLLAGETDASKQLGTLYRDAGRRYILAFATIAATLAAVPLPFATMPVLTALQVSMVGLLGKLYGQTVSPSQAGGIVSAIAGGFLAQAIGRELIKFIPGFGSVIAASWAAAYTWALGEGACVYFGDLMGGKTPDPAKIQQVMADAFQVAKERFKQL